MGLILPFRSKNPLVFPATAPGINWAHPAAQGFIRYSGVALNGDFISLMNGSAGTVTASPTALINSALGPAVKFSGTTDAVTVPVSTATDTTLTIGCIFVANTSNSAGVLFTTDSQRGTNTIRLTLNSLGIEVNTNSAVDFPTGVSVTIGVPYFLAVTLINDIVSSMPRFVLKRLDTGQVITFPVSSPSAIIMAPSAGIASIGTGVRSNLVSGASIAAVCWTTALLSTPQLLQWSNDPWSFWYPQKTDLAAMLKTPAAPSFTLPGYQPMVLM
jgi:hypothetical protein